MHPGSDAPSPKPAEPLLGAFPWRFLWKSLGVAAALVGGYLLLIVLSGTGQGTRRSIVPADFHRIDSALRMYKIQNGRPTTTAQGLQSLVEKPTIPPVPEHWVRLITKLPEDPWRNPYRYCAPGRNGAEWEILCAGKDGQWGTADDICSQDEEFRR